MNMRKIIVLSCFLALSINNYAQVKEYGYDRYNDMIDSLLVVFGNDIQSNLSLDEYSIPKVTSWGIQVVGSCFILEVFFIPKRSNILTLSGTTGSMFDKFFKQNKGFRIIKRAYFETFRRDIQENGKLPYNIIDYFSYKFITPYDNSQKNHAIYGEYKFRLNDEKYEIAEKKIEILQGRDAIMRKYRTTF